MRNVNANAAECDFPFVLLSLFNHALSLLGAERQTVTTEVTGKFRKDT